MLQERQYKKLFLKNIITDLEKRKFTVNKEELKSHQEAKVCYICGKRILKELSKSIKYLTGEEILPSDQSRIIEQARFTYSPLGKAFEKQIKTIEEQEKR